MSYLVTIDGLSGSGKTTALKLVCNELRSYNLKVNTYHDRLGDPTAALLDEAQHGLSLSPLSRLYFMLAMRRQVIDASIMPSLARDDVTITDRYYPSTIAYQAYGQGLDVETVARLALQAAEGAHPERIFYIDVPASVALERMAARGTAIQVFDDAAVTFHERVRRGYLAQAHNDRSFIVIDGMQAKENVAEKIYKVIIGDLLHRPTPITAPATRGCTFYA